MGHLVFMVSAIGLLAGFLAVTRYEAHRGARFFEAQRIRFDRYVTRIRFIIDHVDFGAFFIEESHRIVVRVGHDIAHIFLVVVRAIEKLLTRAVRHFRSRRADAQGRESVRGYVKTLIDFKDRLKATQSDISDIQ